MKPTRPEKVVQPINENLRYPRMQVINYDGANLGVISRDEALRAAYAAGLDLVLIAEQGAEGVPVAKVMDFGKAQYLKKKKQAEAKKHQKTIEVKEIRLRPKIGDHDFKTKMNQAIQFLKDGKHIKFTIAFRGREIVNKDERGNDLFAKIDEMLSQSGLTNIAQEKDSKIGQMWTRNYYLKSGK